MPDRRARKVVVKNDSGDRVEAPILVFVGATVELENGAAKVTVSGGGGTSNHSLLTSLAWTTSGHTLTPDRLAGSDGAGAAVAATITAPLAYSSSALSLSGWSGSTDGALLYRSGGSVASATATAPVVFSGGALSVSVFTGDTGSGGATGLVPAPSAGDGTQGKYLSAAGDWAAIPAGLVTFYLDSTDASDISGYKTALTQPSTAGEATLTVGATGTTDNLLASFATEPGIPGTTLLPHGMTSFHFHVATGAANQIGRLKLEIYTCASDGTSETLRASGYSDSFWDVSQETNTDVVLSSSYTLATTDRIVYKLYGARVSGPATCDITVYFAGTTRQAYVLSTFGALNPALIGAQPLDADLTALAGLSSTGLIVRTGAGTAATATVSAPLTLTGSTLAVSAASTSAAGVVELATDGEAIADRAVQGNDSRLGMAGGSAVAMAVWAGTGAGGDVTLDGTATPSWASVSTISGVRTYTVTSEAVVELDTVTFDFSTYSSIAVVSKGAIFSIRNITTTGTGTGYFDWNGGNASNGTAGVGAAQVGAGSPLAGGGTGAAGRNTTGAGVNVGSNMQGLSLGGVGGAGGAIGASAGGNGGTLFRDFLVGVSKYGSIVDIIQRGSGLLWTGPTASTQYQLMGGAGGGSGANQSTGVSGGGGGGGGVVLLRVGSIDMGANTLYLRASGGNGAAGSGVSGAGTSAGGGGGAGGGVLLVVASVTGTVILQAHGGNGGNGVTNDADVAAGGVGGNGGLVACIYGSGTAPTGTATGGTGGTGSGGAAAANGTDGTVYIASAVF